MYRDELSQLTHEKTVTMKKNNNIKTISGKAAVFTAGIPFFFFLNLDMC